MPMDSTDHRLIALLRKDARMSVAALAAKLGVSRGTVTNRLRKLEDAQVIVGYAVRLRPDAEPNQIRAWMGVLVDGNQTRAVVPSFSFPGATIGPTDRPFLADSGPTRRSSRAAPEHYTAAVDRHHRQLMPSCDD